MNKSRKGLIISNNANQYITAICRAIGCDEEDIKSTSREGDIPKLRHVVRYLLHVNSDLTLRQIAQLTGAGDHSVTMRSIDKIEGNVFRGVDEFLRIGQEAIDNLDRQFNGTVEFKYCENQALFGIYTLGFSYRLPCA